MKHNFHFSPDLSKGNSFDFIRLLFAFSVFVAHFGVLTSYKADWYPISSHMGVIGFFIISGFLITRSYCNSLSLQDYIQKRIRRIMPAYMIVVLLCAVILSLLSALPLYEYFFNKEFLRYLAANITTLNFIQPILPEVFSSNILPYVNGSLWTIKIEITLYAIVPIVVLLLRWKPAIMLAVVYIFSFVFVVYMDYLFEMTGKEIYSILSRQFVGQLRYFISGMLLLLYFDWLMKNRKFLLPLSLLCFIANYFFQSLVIDFFYPISFAIIIVCFAYYFKQLSVIARFGDFSYGFYLFHFPVIQTMFHFGWLNTHPVLLFVVCFLITLSLAILSWHLLEKKFLKRTL
jgi:peptidoglycan/LPS O-acetylase OafA/YrhL